MRGVSQQWCALGIVEQTGSDGKDTLAASD